MKAHGSSPARSRSNTTVPSSSPASARSTSRLARRGTRGVHTPTLCLARRQSAQSVREVVRAASCRLGSSHAEARPTARRRREPGTRAGAGARAAIAPLRAPGRRRAAGDTSDFEFRSFHADYTLTRDADQHAHLDVVETAVAVFPSIDQNRGIIRAIPDYYGDVFLDTTVLSVTDENGAPLPYSGEHDGGFTLIRIGDADVFVHGADTYVIHYTQVDTIRYFADTDDDEFYWDVNGTGWEQPFDEVSAHGDARPRARGGARPATSRATRGRRARPTPCSGGIVATPDRGRHVIEASAADLEPGENLTIVVAVRAAHVRRGRARPERSPYDPDAADRPRAAASGLGRAALARSAGCRAALGIVAAVVLRRKKAVATSTIIPQYSVPKGLDVMIAAEMIEQAPHGPAGSAREPRGEAQDPAARVSGARREHGGLRGPVRRRHQARELGAGGRDGSVRGEPGIRRRARPAAQRATTSSRPR